METSLNQFADRLLLNGEVKEFIRGLVEKSAEQGQTIIDIRSVLDEIRFEKIRSCQSKERI